MIIEYFKHKLNYKNLIEVSITLFTCLLLILIPQINFSEYIQSTLTSKYILFTYGCLVNVGLFIIYIVVSKEYWISISKSDLALFFLLCFILINRFFLQENVGFSLRFLELISLSLIYVMVRNLSIKSFYWLLIAMIISGIIQAIYGNLQLLGYYSSNHSGFKMTGSFFNPGPYAGFLTSIWPVTLGIYLFKEKVIEQLQSQIKSTSKTLNKGLHYAFNYIPLVGVISIVLVLPAAQSRASWLAVLISSVILLEFKYKLIKKYIDVSTVLKKVLLTIIVSTVIGTGLFGIYHFKKGSSDGRLFIWKVTTEMIQENLVFGVGFDRFKANYMNYQADYFADNGETTEAIVADNTYYAFNELLQLTAENGLVGLILLGIILALLFNIKIGEGFKLLALITKVTIIAIGTFACFSYPMQLLPIKLVLVCLIGLIVNLDTTKTSVLNTNQNSHKYFLSVLKIGIFGFGILGIVKGLEYTKQISQGFKGWRNASTAYYYGDYEGAIEEYQKVYSIFKNDGEFLMNYGKTLAMVGEHNESIETLILSQKYLNTTIIETTLGDSYKVKNKYDKAEVAYQQAAYMIPSRFYPSYLLAKLYEESGQREKAISKANELLKKDVKIPSTAIKEIRIEMKKIIKKYKNNVILNGANESLMKQEKTRNIKTSGF